MVLSGPLDYPTDPTANIYWTDSGGECNLDAGYCYANFGGVSDIEMAFNNARTQENTQLGESYPMLAMPSQSEWDGMSDGQKALWLINRERIDRGVHPLHGLETNVTNVAQGYAEYLIDNNAWGGTTTMWMTTA